MLNIIIILLIYLSLLILLDISPIQKIFILILLYILGSLLMLILDNYYLGLTYIIIYVGAIAILFQFIIMMMNIQYINQKDQNKNKLKLLIFFIIILLLLPYLYNIDTNIYNYLNLQWTYNYIKLYDIHIISIFLYSGYNISILIIGQILWTILIGILGLKK